MFRSRATDGPSFFSKYREVEGKKVLVVRVPKGRKVSGDNRYQKNWALAGFLSSGAAAALFNPAPAFHSRAKIMECLRFFLSYL